MKIIFMGDKMDIIKKVLYGIFEDGEDFITRHTTLEAASKNCNLKNKIYPDAVWTIHKITEIERHEIVEPLKEI